jgi:hypothetical protein
VYVCEDGAQHSVAVLKLKGVKILIDLFEWIGKELDFLNNVITVQKSWIFQYSLETESQNTQCKSELISQTKETKNLMLQTEDNDVIWH